MKIIEITGNSMGQHAALVVAMHRLRKQIFKERLDWSVSVTGDMEMDEYDTLRPTYLVLAHERDVVGSVRLLPTTGSNMLANTFPFLVDGHPMPSSPAIHESSRFCVDTAKAGTISENGLHQATFMLFAAMIEWGMKAQLEAIATVTDARMERILRRAGWPLTRLGAPKQIGTTKALAGLLPIRSEYLDAIRRAGQLDVPILHQSETGAIAA